MWNKRKTFWISISVVNLFIVAALGLLMRSKILFCIPFVDFKYILHAHSHFAFAGWVTPAIALLMIDTLLSAERQNKNVYQWLLGLMLFNATGMLCSFPFQGYAFWSILFSTLFVFTSFVFSAVFIRDLWKEATGKNVKLLGTAALAYLVLSSAGPFTLAYLMATRSANAVLYRDAVYSYLHLQYNGFFTLAIFALIIHKIGPHLQSGTKPYIRSFALLLNVSVIPSMFLSYLWHYPNNIFRVIAGAGSICMALTAVCFVLILWQLRKKINKLLPVIRFTGSIALAAFTCKLVFQSLTIFHAVGELVFANRPLIIGFLHLVLLAFVSLYLLSHYLQNGWFKEREPLTRIALVLFSSAAILNEVLLFTQGLFIALELNNDLFPWLLFSAAGLLFAGALLLVIARVQFRTRFRLYTQQITDPKRDYSLN